MGTLFRLFEPQSDYRIDPCRTPRGKVTRGESHADQNRRNCEKCDWIGRAHIIKKSPHDASATGWGGSLFTTTMASIDFGSVHTATGDLSVARDYTAIATNPDPEVRRAGYLRNEAGLAEHRETYATILAQTAEALNTVARLRHYDDYADKAYGARFLDRKQVLALLNSLADAADINKHIEKRVVDHYRTTYGLDSVHVWDLFLPEPRITVPRFTIDRQVRRWWTEPNRSVNNSRRKRSSCSILRTAGSISRRVRTA